MINRVRRNAALRGISCASDVHDAFGSRRFLLDGRSAFDVFALIAEMGIPLAFRDLDKLLGACVRIGRMSVGILVTSRRDLHLQRFTAAHELGHVLLEHETGVDLEVARFGANAHAPKEVEADAFAGELLMPRWLVKAIAARHGWWSRECLSSPRNVYQLSLRLAASYEATARTLAAHNYVDDSTLDALLRIALKKTKLEMLKGFPLADPWADVWEIGPNDNGCSLAAGPNDVFLLPKQFTKFDPPDDAVWSTLRAADGAMLASRRPAGPRSIVSLIGEEYSVSLSLAGAQDEGVNSALFEELH